MTILRDAKQNILERKKLAEEEAYLNLVALREKDDFWEAESRYHSISFEIAKLKVENADFGYLNAQLSVAKNAYIEVLKKYGKTIDDLIPRHRCEICKDTGVINGVACVCLKREIQELSMRLTDRVATPDTLFPEVFPGFTEEDNRHNLSITGLVARWTDAFPAVSKNLIVLTGKTGVGKSYLASIVTNLLNERGFGAIFLNAQRLNDLFLQSHLASLSEKTEILLPVYQADLLVIDDLGAESFLKNVTAEQLYTLLSVRSSLPILITTNLSPAAIRERYGERIFSRLSDKNSALNLEMRGVDLRLIKR